MGSDKERRQHDERVAAELSVEVRAMNSETWAHIHRVQQLLGQVVCNLMKRMDKHDQSKLKSPEAEIFAEFTPKLKGVTYGSEEYRDYMKQMKTAIDHHNAHNSHHPEHYGDGIKGMTLIDLIEMMCDWKAASERHDDGDVFRSVNINHARFGYSEDLRQIFHNTQAELKELW